MGNSIFSRTSRVSPDAREDTRPRRRRCARLREERGVAMVEFALVLPLLALLIMGIIDFGRALNYWIDETHLANEGARWAAVSHWPSSGSLQDYIKSQIETPELKNGTGSVSKAAQVCITPGAKVGDPVTVTVTAKYHWLKIIGISTDSTLTGSATMRMEALPTYSAGCA
jgi:Flp pilus assembly protein TadG